MAKSDNTTPRTLTRVITAVAQALRFDRPEILAEQLRLVYGGMTMSVLPMFPAIALLLWVLHSPGLSTGLVAWGMAATLTNGYSMYDARRRLRQGFGPTAAPRLARRMLVSLAAAGFVWGALVWIALGHSGMRGDVLVLFVVSGIVAGGLALLSPILPAFLAFAVPAVVVVALAFVKQADPAYNAFIAVTFGYGFALFGQARISASVAKAAIETKFENADLVHQAQAARLLADHAREQADLARLDAEAANQAKSKFLAAASHDLRQPIHAQGLFLDVLQRMPLPEPQLKLVQQVSAAREATVEMLNTLLDFSRIEAGVVQANVKSFDMQSLLNRLEREFASQADAKGLAYRSRETKLQVQSDPALVALIARNFIANAIRYTERGGLLVTCRQRGNWAVFAVRDTGLGIAPQHQAEVFKEFHQLGNPERDRRKGLGLGLAIASKLAETLGVRIALKSWPGRGSDFSVSLPLSQQCELLSDTVSSVPAQPPNGHALQARVLVIDDEEAVRLGSQALLQSWGCTCVVAESIAQAVSVAPGFAPQAIVSDYRLRERETGIAAVRAVRACLGTNTPAVLITGDTAPERLREALSGGIPLLHKPVQPAALHEALNLALGNRLAA